MFSENVSRLDDDLEFDICLGKTSRQNWHIRKQSYLVKALELELLQNNNNNKHYYAIWL